MERVWKKYGIYLDQKGKNPDYFPDKYRLAQICNGDLSKVNNGCVLNSQQIAEHIFFG